MKRRTVSKKWVILGVAIAVSLVMVISTIQLSSKYPGFGIHVANVETVPYTRSYSGRALNFTKDWLNIVVLEFWAKVTVTLHNYNNSDANVTIKIYAVDGWMTFDFNKNQAYINNRQETDGETRTIFVRAHSDAKTTCDLRGLAAGNIIGLCQILEIANA
jgi:hypothetical protein